ncbi:MAG: ImmA/IrrE family metallo-endopeptidase [Verrucomicrobiaceae bacterium]|nr:MAG: ImmA/IrrE family metallo-endopeptidase [Verrucomicrobiaceae bacterium]
MVLTLQPKVLEWARHRMRFSVEDAAKSVGVAEDKIEAWESTGNITHTDLEKLARGTRTPIGYLFLSEVPEIRIPLADFRTVGSKPAGPPSPEMLEVIFTCERRQDWFRSHQLEIQAPRLEFVGSAPVGTDPVAAARAIRTTLRFHPSYSHETTLDGVLRECIEATEAMGVLVVRNGIVGNSTNRKLQTSEFRGFALSDDLAPVLFINGSDAKAAQIFTWIHELAHIFAGVSALNNSENTLPETANPIESFCNHVAAEYLVPADELRRLVESTHGNPDRVVNAARLRYRVSDLVIVRRLYDIGELSKELFEKWYLEKLDAHQRDGTSPGGNFYVNQRYRIGPRFAKAVIASTLEGKTMYSDALSLLDLQGRTFERYASRLGFEF